MPKRPVTTDTGHGQVRSGQPGGQRRGSPIFDFVSSVFLIESPMRWMDLKSLSVNIASLYTIKAGPATALVSAGRSAWQRRGYYTLKLSERRSREPLRAVVAAVQAKSDLARPGVVCVLHQFLRQRSIRTIPSV